MIIQELAKFWTIQGRWSRSTNLPGYLSWARYYAFKNCDQVSRKSD